MSTGAVGFFTLYNVYRGNEKFYEDLFMPCLHRLDPETTHRFAVLAAKYGSRFLPKAVVDTPSLVSFHKSVGNFC